jgi:hypothetical protein
MLMRTQRVEKLIEEILPILMPMLVVLGMFFAFSLVK